MINKALITEERLATLRAGREKMRAEKFDQLREKLGDATVDELKKTYELFDETLYIWVAGLWEPAIGGFYYSNSARDYEGFLPDIESTRQALGYIQGVGLCQGRGDSFITALSAKSREKLLNYAQSLQHEDDGYFYHPQWGKGVTVSRRGRDLGWALSLIGEMGGKPNYPTPMDRAQDATAQSTLPEYLQSTAAWRAYLTTLDIAHRSYSVGNHIQSQVPQIKGAGDEYVKILLDWYDNSQNPANGTWEEQVNYASINGLMKVTLAYSAYAKKMPNADKAVESAITATLSDEVPTGVTSIFNPWVCIHQLLDNLRNNGDADKADVLYAKILEQAPEMIRITREKLIPYKSADGSYSYNRGGFNSYRSQGAYVAVKGVSEGEINGNGLATNGTVRELFGALGVPRVPYYTAEDGDLFFELLETATESPKIYPAVPDPKKA